MPIQKITNEEILTLGVKSLPNRPSTPSLYDGNALSAEELKAAFDRLPTLIAERFNALLLSTGLFDEENPRESFADLIATKISSTHSLAQFFEDVQNGSLASYLALSGEEKLADVISAMRSDILLLQKGGVFTAEDILKRANEYTDNPMGAVTEKCHLPVSGKVVHKALSSLSAKLDPERLDARIGALETAAKNVLYTYPDTSSKTAYTRAAGNILSNAALCKLGGVLHQNKNAFPEKILTTYAGQNLTITWDDVSGCLVMNGTLTPQNGRIRLAVFNEYIPEYVTSVAFYYRGGEIEGLVAGKTTLSLTAEDDVPIIIPLQMANYVDQNFVFETSSYYFAGVHLETENAVTFRDFRFNIQLKNGCSESLAYTPFVSGANTTFPEAVHVLGPNEWYDNPNLEATGYIYIPINLPDCLSLGLSLLVETDVPGSSVVFMQCVTTAGEKSTIKFSRGARYKKILSEREPIVGIQFFVSGGKDPSCPYHIRIYDFQIERFSILDYEELAPYSEPFSHTFTLPESLSRFRESFFGIDEDTCNHFNFERGFFVRMTDKFTVNGSLTWEADASVSGRYHAAFTPPAAAIGKEFHPSSLFTAATEATLTNESLSYTENKITVQSALFASPEDVKAFFTICPIDIIYAITSVYEFFTPEEVASLRSPILPMAPRAHIYITDGEGDLLPAYLLIKYQTKIQEEVSA